MHRPTVGILALLLLIIGAVLYLAQYDSGLGSSDNYEQLQAACLRIGAILGVIWLAHPELSRLSPWMLGAVLVSLLVVMRWPKLLIPALIALVAVAILKPRNKRSNQPNQRMNRR